MLKKEICCSFKSFAGETYGCSYREDRRCISQVVPLLSWKKDISSPLQRDPETEVDLILSRAGILETPKDIDDFTICPTHRSNLGTGVGWIRCSISRCRVPREVCGHGKGKVKSIPKAYWGIGKRVPQIVRKTSGKFI